MGEYVIGIAYGHNATVAVAKKGKIIFCQSEERLNRIKNSTGFPEKTIEYVYKNICKPSEVSSFEFYQKSIFGYIFLKNHNFKSIQYGNYLLPNFEKKTSGFKSTELYWNLSRFRCIYLYERNKKLKQEALNYFLSKLKTTQDKINYVDHHTTHAYSAIANIKDWANGLVFTLDAQGDYLSGSISQFKNSHLKIIQTIDERDSLADFYSAITSLLGMKEGEHEFKVMGLAPYADSKYYNPILDKLKELVQLDSNGRIKVKYQPIKNKNTLAKIIRFKRFDNIAAAIQILTEDLLISWINFWIKKTGINNVAVSGGIFMNVKACQRILDECNINKYFVVPSAADESTAIGAAFYGSLRSTELTHLSPLKDLYLGMSYNDKEIYAYLMENKIFERYEVSKPDNINYDVANLLSKNEIVARFSGNMEFGARALGNRSILANPSDFSTVEEINAKIKIRDFWMPFTPSIIEEDLNKYIQNEKNMFCPYMVITFNSTKLAQKQLKAAIHPRDKTVRPQCVIKNWNPEYYDLILEFKKITGIGAVLNTSFNLHGEPNVCSPSDAIHTLDNSDLKYLILGSYLLKKKVT